MKVGTCSLCNDPRRAEIDAAHVAGASIVPNGIRTRVTAVRRRNDFQNHPGMRAILRRTISKEVSVFGRNVHITRRELYELVWSTPMITAAERFRMSDRGLAKVCDRHDIPVPERGWWAKKEAGQEMAQPPLPTIDNQYHERIEIYVRDDPRDWLYDEERAEFDSFLEREKSADFHVVVAENEQSRRREIVALRRALRDEPKGGITKATHGRVTRIMTAILLALERRGYGFKFGARASASVTIAGEEMSFHIEEKYRQVDHVLTKSEERERAAGKGWWIEKYDHLPTGNLRLAIEDYAGEDERRSFADGAVQRLEDCLGEFMVTLIRTAMTLRARKNYLAEQERARKEQERRRQEEAARIAAERKRRRELFRAVAAFRSAEALRTLMKAVEGRASLASSNDKVQQWLTYAAKIADEIDPLPRILNTGREA